MVAATTKQRRKAIPVGVKLQVALRALGYESESEVRWDHHPALGLREWDDEAGDYVPPQHDPKSIQILAIDPHAVKTNGRPASAADGDIHKIAKAKRLAEAQEAFRARVLSREPGEPRKPVGKIKSRGFERRGSTLR